MGTANSQATIKTRCGRGLQGTGLRSWEWQPGDKMQELWDSEGPPASGHWAQRIKKTWYILLPCVKT